MLQKQKCQRDRKKKKRNNQAEKRIKNLIKTTQKTKANFEKIKVVMMNKKNNIHNQRVNLEGMSLIQKHPN
jgi:hypothetical protein